MADPLAVVVSGVRHVLGNPWLLIGFGGQALFMGRFLVQWIQSERQKRSVIPVAFWFFSLGGGMVLLSYAIHQRDPVFIAGQGLGLFIYIRNLALIFRERRNPEAKTGVVKARELAQNLAVQLREAAPGTDTLENARATLEELEAVLAKTKG